MAHMRSGASLMDRDEREIGVGAEGEVDARVGECGRDCGAWWCTRVCI
jgi:hypothetical protein